MTSPVPFGPIAELLERNLSIRHVYGEPVQHGDMTVMLGCRSGGGSWAVLIWC